MAGSSDQLRRQLPPRSWTWADSDSSEHGDRVTPTLRLTPPDAGPRGAGAGGEGRGGPGFVSALEPRGVHEVTAKPSFLTAFSLSRKLLGTAKAPLSRRRLRWLCKVHAVHSGRNGVTVKLGGRREVHETSEQRCARLPTENGTGVRAGPAPGHLRPRKALQGIFSSLPGE